MANTYFDFKQFRIEQSQCANKVSTDACIFGAFVANQIKEGTILDIGTGSGLLALMLAQKSTNKIIGIEMDAACAQQARENINQSKFAHQIEILEQDVRLYTPKEKFDIIISNPPFFNNSHPNPNQQKHVARQTETLAPKDWMQIIHNCAKENTQIFLLLANNDVSKEYDAILYDAGFTFRHKTMLFDKENRPNMRLILRAQKSDFKTPVSNTLNYKNTDGSYTKEFITLLRDYYLYL